MVLTFLGTGTSQGVPVVACNCNVCRSVDTRDKRLRSAVMVETEGKRIIIDCGPDFRQQMLREDICSIDALLITHAHKDHIGGLDDVRAFNYILQRPAEVYASREVQRAIKKEFSYAFGEDKYPGTPEINLHLIGNRQFDISGLLILPIKVLHFNDYYIFGYRIGDLTYITDAHDIPEKEMKKIEGSRVIVINALRKKKHYSHFNLSEAVAILEKLKPEQGYLTHISHQMGCYEDVQRELPSFIKQAYDGLKVEL
ncbi:MAG: MBL fold metallo-hydrolase [Bacteroidales bacterium]